MKDWQSQTHVKWDCKYHVVKYHVVIVPKYRQRVFFGKRRKQIVQILRDLCRQKEIGLVKGECAVRPYPHAAEHSAEVFRGNDAGVPERQKVPCEFIGSC